MADALTACARGSTAVDIVFAFHPIFASSLLPNLRIARSVYVQPRCASLISFATTNNDGIATKCPGY